MVSSLQRRANRAVPTSGYRSGLRRVRCHAFRGRAAAGPGRIPEVCTVAALEEGECRAALDFDKSISARSWRIRTHRLEHIEVVGGRLISGRLCPAHEVNNEKYDEKGPKSATHIHVILRLPITLH